ncbi:MAG TPA: thiamine pyrophosphate-dependent enzyme, partial [Gammaproteobacteria bacterium]|nr:thiamine pyrophosphate-dependent enzyme [Gammaproteobacteria bacterium]
MAVVARFEIRYEQILDPEGKLVVKRLPDFARDPEELLRMYRKMTLTRVFDARAIALQRTGKLGTYASCLGHEATHLGVGAAMKPEDVLAPSYREYGAQFWRGVKPEEVLLYWGGSELGNDFA